MLLQLSIETTEMKTFMSCESQKCEIPGFSHRNWDVHVNTWYKASKPCFLI